MLIPVDMAAADAIPTETLQLLHLLLVSSRRR